MTHIPESLSLKNGVIRNTVRFVSIMLNLKMKGEDGLVYGVVRRSV